MKRNKRKTFAYRPSDKIISRESIVSVILGAAVIIGYYLLLFGSIKTGGTGKKRNRYQDHISERKQRNL